MWNIVKDFKIGNHELYFAMGDLGRIVLTITIGKLSYATAVGMEILFAGCM